MNPTRPHLHLVTDPGQSEEDRLREDRIAGISKALEKALKMGAFGVSRAMALQEELRTEIAARSPAQVARMERARGLRK